MFITPIKDGKARFDLIQIKESKPHCKIHGELKCIATKPNGKVWVCIPGNRVDCRAGCEERIIS